MLDWPTKQHYHLESCLWSGWNQPQAFLPGPPSSSECVFLSWIRMNTIPSGGHHCFSFPSKISLASSVVSRCGDSDGHSICFTSFPYHPNHSVTPCGWHESIHFCCFSTHLFSSLHFAPHFDHAVVNEMLTAVTDVIYNIWQERFLDCMGTDGFTSWEFFRESLATFRLKTSQCLNLNQACKHFEAHCHHSCHSLKHTSLWKKKKQQSRS